MKERRRALTSNKHCHVYRRMAAATLIVARWRTLAWRRKLVLYCQYNYKCDDYCVMGIVRRSAVRGHRGRSAAA